MTTPIIVESNGVMMTNTSGRRLIFTPERIAQISNLLERGKSREEIADIIGCTVGTLAVTCSRLGISLRKPKSVDYQPRKPNNVSIQSQHDNVPPIQPQREDDMALSPVKMSIVLTYKGATKSAPISLTIQDVATLAIMADVNHLTLVEMAAKIILDSMRE